MRDVESPLPARFNADPSRLHEASGSAGRLVLFAVRLDTFEAEAAPTVFYLGTDQPAVLEEVRRRLLSELPALPIAGEYMHRDMFDVADRYGKDTVVAIERLGTARLPALSAFKASLDRLPLLPQGFGDRLLQRIGRLFPDHLPPRLRQFRDRFAHHLMLKVGGALAPATEALLRDALDGGGQGDLFRCTDAEAAKAFLHRFAAAGAAVRYRALHRDTVEDIVALDVALPRNALDWFEQLPPEFDAAGVAPAVLRPLPVPRAAPGLRGAAKRRPGSAGAKAAGVAAGAWGDGARRSTMSATCITPRLSLAAHYRALDPCNCLNPGIGRTSRLRCWGEPAAAA